MSTGRVTAFDAEGGWGVATTDRGDTYEFHATGIASGERTIEVGAAIAFVRIAGRGGRWEADRITPIDGGPRPDRNGP